MSLSLSDRTEPSPERDDLPAICDRLQPELGAMAGKHVLITGGAGFLGYYLVRTLLFHNEHRPAGAAPIRVTVYDNYQRGMPDWLGQLAASPELTLVTHDVTRRLPPDMPELDYIVHAASIASPTFYRRHPVETMDANVLGLRYLLDHCRERGDAGAGVAGFLFFSTSEIYGDPTPDDIPTPETYRGNVSCTGPRACYDESKRYGETLCVNFFGQYGVPCRIARPFNNYGPGLKITDRRLLPDFARAVLAGDDIVMYSDGSPTRTFCYIADAVVGYYKVLVGGRSGEAYNIGVDRPEVSVAEVAERVAALARELFSYQGKVVHRAHSDPDYLVDTPNRCCPVIDKARGELGFEPEVALDDGLRRTLTWYQNHPTAEDE